MSIKERYWEESTVTAVASEMIAEISRLVPIHRTKIQTNSCALLVIDMQRCFLDGENLPSAPAIIPNINRLIQAFRQRNRPIIFTRHQNIVADASKMLRIIWHILTYGVPYRYPRLSSLHTKFRSVLRMAFGRCPRLAGMKLVMAVLGLSSGDSSKFALDVIHR